MKIVNLLKYQLQTYFKGSGFVMPFVVTSICIYAIYSIKPQEIVSSYVLSGNLLFLVMIWIGMATVQNEKIVEEEILYLRMENDFLYYFGKFLFLVSIALFMSIIYTFIPAIYNMINGFDLFSTHLGVYEIVNVFLLQIGEALLGVSVGSFLHPRVMKDRKIAIALTVMIAVIALASMAIKQKVPVLKWILWIFPPVTSPMEIYGMSEEFELRKTLLIFCIMLAYTMCYACIKGAICKRVKW